MAVDAAGRIGIVGAGGPADPNNPGAGKFPTKNAMFNQPVSAYSDILVAVLDTATAPPSFEFSSIYGDTYQDEGYAIWMDGSSVWVGGNHDTSTLIASAGMATPGAFQTVEPPAPQGSVVIFKLA